jgi:NAD(P)-dependent dehydrogenase (short-subunit alcohol dehydrogenase family)
VVLGASPEGGTGRAIAEALAANGAKARAAAHTLPHLQRLADCVVYYAALEYGPKNIRVGDPEDFANTVLWLTGPSYVAGLNLQVNGVNRLTRLPTLPEISGGASAYGSGNVFDDR